MNPVTRRFNPPDPTVVVIIPFYDGASFIERAVRSVFEQTVAADEVVVVNDGSSPEERLALGLLAERYPFRIVDKENGGQGSARNAGVKASSANYICFLDQDDFYLPNHIEILVEAIPANEARFGFVYADLYEADADANVIRTGVVKLGAKSHPKTDLFDLLRHDMFVLPSASLISRTAFDAVGGFDPQFTGYEDDDLFLRIFRKGYTNHFVDRAVTVWCIHTASTSFGIRMVRSRFRYFMKLVAAFPDEPRRSLFYLRDYLVPRFQSYFVDHAIDSAKHDSQYRAEMLDILIQYAAVIFASPSVQTKSKLKLRITIFLLRHVSPSMVAGIGSLTKLPGLRAVRRLLD
ncbi:glycosyltransferase family 2 protein [Variovorax paradoxus]|uniref:glycosyltransferase family 2 protein n=1 Tax=Variovorax paradoxus TaxID=34073 RepID=UPI002785A7F7|nr:glycosyltransferase family A protein [Variovorax paradoxus]MDQ0587760.1 glycosyltransferase involved in cell wall biosynthesis [Variovorax paradoxus]